MQRHFIISAISLTLAGCINIPAGHISSMHDSILCQHANKKPYNYDQTTWNMLMHEKMRRNLDCNPNHLSCTNYGLTKGTKEYSDCRMRLNEMVVEQNNQQQWRDTLEDMQRRENRQGILERPQIPTYRVIVE